MKNQKILTNVGFIGIETLKNWLGLNKQNVQTFKLSLTHSQPDADNGKQFSIPNFPSNSIIREIRLRSNFTAGLQPRQTRSYITNPTGILPTDTSIELDPSWISGFAIGDYIYLGDTEIALITSIDTITNSMTVTRGVKGTTATYHDYNSSIEVANSGIRIIIFKNSQRKFTERIKSLHMLMTSDNTIKNAININDKMINFNNTIYNIGQYDLLYFNDSTQEIISVENINNIVQNSIYNNTAFVSDPMKAHAVNTDVQKINVYDIPIPYSGDNTLYGVVYVDEEIDDTLYPSGITVDMEITVGY